VNDPLFRDHTASADGSTVEIARLQAEVARLERVAEVARRFCERVERGEIRSQSTYLQFRAALQPTPGS